MSEVENNASFPITEDTLGIISAVIKKYCSGVGKSFLSNTISADIIIKSIDKKSTVRIYHCVVSICHQLIVVIPNNPKLNLDEIIKKSHIRT